MHLVDVFIQSDFLHSSYTFLFIFCQYVCVPWELNQQPFVLLTQCSTTEPQEHYVIQFNNTVVVTNISQLCIWFGYKAALQKPIMSLMNSIQFSVPSNQWNHCILSVFEIPAKFSSGLNEWTCGKWSASHICRLMLFSMMCSSPFIVSYIL